MANNREFVESCTSFAPTVRDEFRALFFDPQTAGGLLIAVAADHAAPLARALDAAGVHAAELGEVVAASKPLIAIR